MGSKLGSGTSRNTNGIVSVKLALAKSVDEGKAASQQKQWHGFCSG